MKPEKPTSDSRPKKKIRPWILALIITCAVAICLTISVAAVLNISKPEKPQDYNFDLTLVDDESNEIITPSLEPIEESEHQDLEDTIYQDLGYEHILILGVDGFEKGYEDKRSDTMLILSINRDQKRVVLSGLPRDTYVYIEGKGYDKVNHAYAYGQAKLSMETLNANFDLNISKYVTVNFNCLIKIIDAVGGVGITLTKAESQHISTHFYTPGTKAGYNVLNGKQALAYCRIRKIDSDVKRNERNYNVLMQLFAKVKKMSPTKYASLFTKIYDDVYTNITLGEGIALATEIMDMGLDSIEHTMLLQGDEGMKIKGTYYEVDKDLVGNLSIWREFLGNTEYKPSDKVQHISDYLSGLWK